jgi:hypothetical protein
MNQIPTNDRMRTMNGTDEITATRQGEEERQVREGTRPAWAVWGGAAVTAGGAMLLAATLVEVAYWEAPSTGLLGVLTVLFLGSTAAHALAMIPLSGGRSGSDGIVGPSLVGRIALLAFGAVFLTSQTVYYTVTYALPEVDDYSGVLTLSTALGAIQLILLLVGAIAIIRAKVATGAARWAFLALSVVAIVTGVIANGTESAEVAAVALLCSTGAQIVVGLVLLTTRSRAR